MNGRRIFTVRTWNACIVTFLAIACAVLFGKYVVKEALVQLSGREATATVTATQFDARYEYVKVRLEVPGHGRPTELLAYKGHPRVGTQLRVRYARSAPSVMQQVGAFPWVSFVAGVLLVPSLGLLADYLWRDDRAFTCRMARRIRARFG